MSKFYDDISAASKGAWVVHHGQKTSLTVNGAAEFTALDTAYKAASLLSQLASTEEATLSGARVHALAKAAGLNPILELPSLLDVLERRRLVDCSESGDVAVLGVTSRATVQHAADIFEEQKPTIEECASIAIAEMGSKLPVPLKETSEFLGDEFKIQKIRIKELLERAENIGFIDAEGRDHDKLFFNGNLFRRENIFKAKRVIDSLTTAEAGKIAELDALFGEQGCIGLDVVEKILGGALFEKLRAAGMYDVHQVANPAGEYGFVTKPAAFHKFNDPLVDDAFDLAKALVAALTYGMTQSTAGRGRITMIGRLLTSLIRGNEIGPATAIGEDYQVLETKGVIQVFKAPSFGYTMKLLKKDVGEMALKVLTTGEAAAANAIDRPFPGTMTRYAGPESTRWDFRRKQRPASKRHTQDVLEALRTKGSI